jgi:hypothetical protein
VERNLEDSVLSFTLVATTFSPVSANHGSWLLEKLSPGAVIRHGTLLFEH